MNGCFKIRTAVAALYLCVAFRCDSLIIQVLREYGGIYLDNDCVVVNEIDRLRKHKCVVSKSSSERFIGKNSHKNPD